MRLLNGLCPQYYAGDLKGSASVCGIDCSSRGMDEIASDAGTLFQDPQSQFFALSVEDELAFALQWRGFSRQRMHQMVREQSRLYGIDPFLKSGIGQMSEGQKQKLALASLTICGLKALILDEPTANLDPQSALDLGARIRALADEGMAVLVADHRLYWLNGVADRVIALEKGKVAFQGRLCDIDLATRSKLGLRAVKVGDPRDALPQTCSAHPAISTEHLCFAYGRGRRVLDDLSFSSGEGIVAILGQNGAGKTTLARVAAGLERPSSGRVLIDGAELRERERLRRVAIVLQNADHQLHMRSVLDEVLFSLRIAGKRCTQPDAMALLSRFGLEELAPRHPQSLSGGQKQRLVIACAFAKEPHLLILDEPTSGLDGANMERIALALEDLEGKGTGIWMITHDLELMERCARSALRL
ncbi:MAG: ABC transporter ATP-binding protein [Succinivibrio sp.]